METMDLVFVHGWSVRSTATYGELPARLEAELRERGETPRVEHIHLGKYVSFNDQVTLDDLALAFDAALREKGLTSFAAITHSTGGPLVRNWVSKIEAPRLLAAASSSTLGVTSRLRHLIMLAPANHGSALAQLGKGRLGRIKAFFQSIEPGQRILDWLELGSEEQWALNEEWLSFEPLKLGIFPFVLTGQSIDSKLYDHLNSYTGEPGSDGVVRVAAANLNYSAVRLEQAADGELHPTEWRRTPESAFVVLPGLSHGDVRMGIMNSVRQEGDHPTVKAVLDCLGVKDVARYRELSAEFQRRTSEVQAAEHARCPNPPHSLVVFRVVDDKGNLIEDYDLLFTAGEDASPDRLPRGFFTDRQRNSRHPGMLSYFLNWEQVGDVPLGVRVLPRPDEGLVRYAPAEVRPQLLGAVLRPNETILVELVLRRELDTAIFGFAQAFANEKIHGEPTGKTINQ